METDKFKVIMSNGKTYIYRSSGTILDVYNKIKVKNYIVVEKLKGYRINIVVDPKHVVSVEFMSSDN
ncbi:hypothetical protein JTZ62_04735 [Mammaliicoccus sciuri]|uniref:hypothetical protein n=1 Tax=Mammaliicoccus sciuri TaxID=1296 RepID=UPI0019D3B5F1|nr:hypothetical protein [Mammaliicoccus sciuri]MEB6232561.1 hypothetical protein [Mammaliicoccus sciuri]QSN68465.1 hypothetical protein JTZ62_04735 [Mammaliicoccus sciuri]UIU23206.1 hypothetical protein LLZ87_04745 [Mammaliicoccus sciuri]UIU26111.1 hypothetical protein LLZ92_04745 [Mammaliicoccus sciuri]